MSDSNSPYVGPRPFTKGDEKIFYGRDAEAQALMSLIMSHSAVLLYSQSGAGKTSLLNAKVRQLLKTRDVEFLGSARVGGSLPPDVDPADISNIFIYFALTSLEGEQPAKKSYDGKTTLPEYLKKIRGRTVSDKEDVTSNTEVVASDKEVVVSDKEGVGSNKEVDESNKGVIDQDQIQPAPVQRVIFFDQFEEIFTTSQQHWENRTEFFEQVGEALQLDPLLRVVFAMREEFLASLNVHVSHLPERLRTRFHLERLRYDAALEAVTKPLIGTNRKFADGVAEQLVRNLLRVPVRSENGFQEITGEFVEPVQLQVVCQNIWNSLPPKVKEIDAAFVESSGDVDVALTKYYEDCLNKLTKKHDIKEARIRRWFDNELITPDGLRGIVYQRQGTTGSLPNGVVKTLEQLRLVRAEPRGGALWYELTHDRFIAPIRKSNRQWFDQQQGGLVSVLETKALEYKNDPRDENRLRGSELDKALELLERRGDDFEVSESVRNYILDSKNAATKRRARILFFRVAAVLVLFLVAALSVAYWAYREKGRIELARYAERVEVANSMISLKKYDAALVWGLKSVEPALIKKAKPSDEGVASLRNALKAFGDSVWSRGFPSSPTIAVSPDARLIFTADDKEWSLWKGADGQQIFKQAFDTDQGNAACGTSPGQARQPLEIASALFSPGGNFLVIRKRFKQSDIRPSFGSAERRGPGFEYEIWDVRNDPRSIVRECGNQSIQFIKDDSRILVAEVGKVRLVELPSNKTILSVQHKSDVTASSPTGQLLEMTNRALIFRSLAETGSKTNRIAFPSSGTLQATFSDDGKRLVTFEDQDSEESRLTFWDAESGKKVAETKIDSTGKFYSLRILRGNTSVLLWMDNPFDETSAAEIWETTTNKITKIDGKLSRANAENDSWQLIRTDGNSKIILVDPLDPSSWVEFKGLPEAVSSFVPSKDLNAAVTLSADNVVQYWNPSKSGEQIDKLSADDLYRAACNQLRYQEKEFKQVATLCQSHIK